MNHVVIFGTDSLAIDAYHDLTHDSLSHVVAFVTDDPTHQTEQLFGVPVIREAQLLADFPPDTNLMLIAVGFKDLNRYRADLFDRMLRLRYRMIDRISPLAHTWSTRRTGIGENCQFGPRSVVHPTATIGKNVIIGPGAMVAHFCKIGDHCYIDAAAMINGSVTIGDYSYIGANANLRNRLHIGRESVIGAGALIMEDTNPREVYAARSASPTRAN